MDGGSEGRREGALSARRAETLHPGGPASGSQGTQGHRPAVASGPHPHEVFAQALAAPHLQTRPPDGA